MKAIRVSAAFIVLVAFGMAVGMAGLAEAVPIPIGGPWQEFSFAGVGVLARGCQPADPAGGACMPSIAGNSVFVGAPPWTFTAPVGGVFFTVTDAFLRGDSFSIFDFGALIGMTPFVAAMGTCGSNPDVCLADPRVSHAIFTLAAGDHSITIVPNGSPFGGGSAYFRVDPVPEPSTLLLLGSGVAMTLALWARRRSK